ncbi:MAG TPA: S8 family serine peptidase [Anaerolineae bacterium]|nr:S8 family serine peptidase [Anaerolineae bacterium]
MQRIQKSFIRLIAVVVLAAFGLWAIRPNTVSSQPQPISRPSPTGLSASTSISITPALAIKFHPTLLKQVLTAESQQPDTQFRVIIHVQPVTGMNAAASLPASASIVDRRRAMVNNLQSIADRSQAGVRALLDQAQLTDRAHDVRLLWINNSVAARVDRSILIALAAREDVTRIDLDEYRKWIDAELASIPQSAVHTPQSVEWNIAKIRADQVWAALGISGTGVVVANMDTGVDWQHPALLASYRGYNPKGLSNHLYSWFDATPDADQYPYDGYGHGTHTMGTLVGSGGIGVAPGAKWIAARVLDNTGSGYDSWIHAGFQWIMAPGGDPSQAPNVLSNSWGNSNGYDQSFRSDVIALNAAGIATFFSNGNSGPANGSVGSPASYPEAFGIGATDANDLIALFSSRGPSPFGPIKPDVSAPGVNVRSSYPGGVYRSFSGTSMAAPHVAGVAALMLSAMPSLTITSTRYILTSTAIRPITSVVYPNNDYGWGRIDALKAVLAVAHTGLITGSITRSDNSAPISIATIQAQSMVNTSGVASTDALGQYALNLLPSTYTLTASAFGYVSQTVSGVNVITNAVTRHDFSLPPLPTGTVQGRVTDLTGTHLLSGSIGIESEPINVNFSGTYSIALPGGVYVIRAQSPLHRIVTATIMITAGDTITQNFFLPDAPRILVVDSGAWYNASEVDYYRQALDDNNYSYTVWPIRDPNKDVPTTSTLRQYTAVLWSSPLDSPGYIGASYAVGDYLKQGGNLLLSGQDVGFWDGYWIYSPYFPSQMLAQYVADDGPTRQLTGQQLFAGQVISISGSGGADNQLYPDVIASLDPLLTRGAFDYLPDQSGGQSIGLCQPQRAVYLAYGFEAINDRNARAEVMSRTFAYFNSPRVRFNYALDQITDPVIGSAGSVVSASIDLHNLDEVAPTTTFSISVSSAWPASITPTLTTINTCDQREITLTVHIPITASIDTRQMVTITAHPVISPVLSVSSTLIVKAPASVLLVDDDRWYPVDLSYRDALNANNISYDLWRVPTSWAGIDPAVPSLDRLSWYPEVIWFTGYDWYQTLTNYDEQVLSQYLAQGGRVLLSSQGYLAEHGLTNFGRSALGILDFIDNVSTTTARGPYGSLFDGLDFSALNFPYPNFTVALAPQPNAQVALIGSHGWPIALLHRSNLGKSMFMAFGFEDLPLAMQPEALNRSIGYLSWLGDSQVKFDRSMAASGAVITATIVTLNDMPVTITQAAYTITLPLSATLKNGNPLIWAGSLLPNQSITATVVITLATDLNAGDVVTLPVQFVDQDHALQFVSTARLAIDAPAFAFDLQPSSASIRPHDLITWTLTARNFGLDAPVAVITDLLPFNQTIVSGSLAYDSGSASYLSGTIRWNGSISAGQSITLSYQMSGPLVFSDHVYYAGAVMSDGSDVWQAGNWLTVQPYQSYLPIVRKG